jgi:hypothetical protein
MYAIIAINIYEWIGFMDGFWEEILIKHEQ